MTGPKLPTSRGGEIKVFVPKTREMKTRGFSGSYSRCMVNHIFYGGTRVSTDGQSVDARARQLRPAGTRQMFRETASGVKTDRSQLRRVVGRIAAVDVLMVTNLDHLARSTRDLLNALASIADRKAGFRSVDDAWADTTTAHGRLMLTVLGGLAEFERELTRTGRTEGRRRAVARGLKPGRSPKQTPLQMKEAIKRLDSGEPVREIARAYNVRRSVISRLPSTFGKMRP